jgi:hypothetical protein
MITQRTLPKIRDSISFLYFDRCIVEQDANAIAIFQKDTKYQIPCANLSTLLLGPGSRITHAALKTLGKNGCQVHWVGEDGFRFYADGNNTKRSVTRLYHQATLWADPQKRLEVIRAMYQFRFAETLAADLTLQQIRGLEGVRVRNTYAQWSKATGVEWQGRNTPLRVGLRRIPLTALCPRQTVTSMRFVRLPSLRWGILLLLGLSIRENRCLLFTILRICTSMKPLFLLPLKRSLL